MRPAGATLRIVSEGRRQAWLCGTSAGPWGLRVGDRELRREESSSKRQLKFSSTTLCVVAGVVCEVVETNGHMEGTVVSESSLYDALYAIRAVDCSAHGVFLGGADPTDAPKDEMHSNVHDPNVLSGCWSKPTAAVAGRCRRGLYVQY